MNEPLKVTTFEGAAINNPVVHAYLTQFYKSDDYTDKHLIETLKSIIVELVNRENAMFELNRELILKNPQPIKF